MRIAFVTVYAPMFLFLEETGGPGPADWARTAGWARDPSYAEISSADNWEHIPQPNIRNSNLTVTKVN